MSIKTFRERSPALIGTLSIIAIAAGTTFAFFINRIPFIKQAYTVQAEFADAAGLRPQNVVRVAGLKVGTVQTIELASGDETLGGGANAAASTGTVDRVLVTMDIQNAVQIPKDAFAEIKLATILGTKYVDIEGTGGGPYLEDGDVIPLRRTSVPYEIYQASNQGTEAVSGINGRRLKNMIVELATLVRATRTELGSALSGLNRLGAGLNARQGDLRSLLQGADRLTALLSEESPTLVRLIDSSNRVLGTIANKRRQVQSLLISTRMMAGNLTDVIRRNRGNLGSILSNLNRALAVLARNVRHLDMALNYAGPSSRYFGSIFTQGRWGDIYSCALVLVATCEQDESGQQAPPPTGAQP